MSDIDRPADRSVKVPHLVFGLFFLGITAVWGLVESDLINTDSLALLAPGVLIVAGIVGLAASLASSQKRRTRGDQSHSSDHPDQSAFEDHQPTEEIR